MGLKFRKRIKIAPGVKVNITSKGISSLSLGGKGATVNVGKNGAKATTSIPGTGLSYTQNLTAIKSASTSEPQETSKTSAVEYVQEKPSEKKVSILLGVGILLIPYVFSWVLLQKGYSTLARCISFGWLSWFLFLLLKG